jgi:acyl-CoA reductase-like NAD-dependent aldehyde dehydrogenase
MAKGPGMIEYQLFIDGRWRAASSGETMPATNPFNQEVHARIAVASPHDVADAIGAARRRIRSGAGPRRVRAPS